MKGRAEYEQALRDFRNSEQGQREIERIFLKVYYDLQGDGKVLISLKSKHRLTTEERKSFI